MNESKQIIRAEGEGERRWFYGGGLHVWKALAEDTNGSFFMFEDHLVRGKVTPLHHHPDMDELLYVIDGELLCWSDGAARSVGPGTTIVTPRGVSHALMVVSESARLLAIGQGSGETFYRHASEPSDGGEGRVDFRKIQEAAIATGTTVVLGPPPFSKP